MKRHTVWVGKLALTIAGLTAFAVFPTAAQSLESERSNTSTIISPVAQASESESDSEIDTEVAQSVMLGQTVANAVLTATAAQYNVSIADLAILAAEEETWTNGCLGLEDRETSCTEALVPGWFVLVGNDEQVWAYRTDATGAVVLLDEVATAEQMAILQTETQVEQTIIRDREEVSFETEETSVVETYEVETYEEEIEISQIEFSQTVETAIFETIVEQFTVERSELRILEVQQREWSDGCLGLESDNACTQAIVPGYLVVVTDEDRVWVYRTDLSGSVVAFDAAATEVRVAQWRNRDTTTISFTDVQSSYWAYDFIRELAILGIIEGYPDNAYRPEQAVTRAEFAAILRRAFEVADIRTAIDFIDVESSYWAYGAIEESYKMGFLNAYSGNQFRPVLDLTRGDVLFAIARGLNLSTESSVESLLAIYEDVELSSDESRLLLAALTEQGIIVNYPDVDVVDLDRVATRAEVAVLVYQTLVSFGYVHSIDSPYVIKGNTVVIHEERVVDSNRDRQNCNQGIGNGAEGCDPGNSRPHGNTNDEDGRTPGN